MIRRYTPDDGGDAIRIWLEASCLSHGFVPREFWEGHAADMANVYLPSSETWVYTDTDGKTAGFLSLTEGRVEALFVDPARQGRGIGLELMRFALSRHPVLELSVYAENTRAVAFYRNRGFVVTQARTDEATGCEEYLMRFGG